jgi:hypothetical protein
MTLPAAAPGRAATLAGALALLGLVVVQLAASLPTGNLMDFGSFWASGEATTRGGDPYGIHPLTFHVVMPGFEAWNPNLNPPVALPLFQLFASFPPQAAFRAWWAVSLVGYALTLGLVLLAYRDRLGPERLLLGGLWALALAGFWDTLVLGQIYVPLAFASVLAFLLLRSGRPVLAGLAIGVLAAVKPNFLVWPALLLIAGHPRAALSAGATFAVLSAAPLLAYGPGVFRAWAAVIGDDPGRATFLTNVSIGGLLQRAGVEGAGLPAGAALLGGLALWARVARPDRLQTSAVALAAALLASPIAWVHYALCLVPVFFEWPRNALLRCAGLLLLVPVPLVLELTDAGPALRATLGSLYGWSMVLCLVAVLGPGRPGFGLTIPGAKRAAALSGG